MRKFLLLYLIAQRVFVFCEENEKKIVKIVGDDLLKYKTDQTSFDYSYGILRSSSTSLLSLGELVHAAVIYDGLEYGYNERSGITSHQPVG